MCQCEGSHCMGHMCLRYSVITQPRFAFAAAVRGFRFHKNDLQVLITDPMVATALVLSSFATISTAGCVAVHAISGAGSYLELNSAI